MSVYEIDREARHENLRLSFTTLLPKKNSVSNACLVISPETSVNKVTGLCRSENIRGYQSEMKLVSTLPKLK
jgi:hypothetical protein